MSLPRPNEIERARPGDGCDPGRHAATRRVERRGRAPHLRERVGDDFFGVGVLTHNGRRKREREAAIPIVHLAERALVAGGGSADESRVRGVNPCRVSRHILQEMATRPAARVKLPCRWDGCNAPGRAMTRVVLTASSNGIRGMGRWESRPSDGRLPGCYVWHGRPD